MSLLSPQLEAFQAVAERGTVHAAAAAAALGLTQTAVTQRVQALERSLSSTVFLRSRRGMRLTESGMALLRYCRSARALEGQTLAQMTDSGRLTPIRLTLAGPTSVMNSRIIPALTPVLKAYPQLLVTFFVVDFRNLADDLRVGAVDLGILPFEQIAREMDSKRLKPERYVLVGAPSWQKRSLIEILTQERIIDFDRSDAMTLAYLKKHHLQAKARSERLFVNSNEPLVHLFSEGIGYGVLTEEVAGPHLRSGSIALLHPSHHYENPLALAWYPRPELPAYFRAVLKALH
jgi:LysR family transcriptional regulator, chromosome initiation inhibitor